MIEIKFPDDIGNQLNDLMPNWTQLHERIQKSHLQKDIFLNNAHETTKRKLEFAMFHLAIMDHVHTTPYPSSDIPELLIRASLEDVFLNLSSALDALAHEINRIYLFNKDYKFVQMDHQGYKGHQECIRCELDKVNDDLTKLLNTEIPQIDRKNIASFKNHWYYIFNEYRNQIVHRTLYVLGYTHIGLFLPDDPANLDPRITKFRDPITNEPLAEPDYSQKRDPKDYSLSCLGKVTEIVENAYSQLITKV